MRDLVKFLSSSEAYEILGDEGTWTAGGCWILGEALVRYLEKGELWVVSSSKNDFEHVVLKIDGQFIDGDGAQSEEDLLQKMEELEMVPDPYLQPMENVEPDGDVSCPADKVDRLVALMEAHGPFGVKKVNLEDLECPQALHHSRTLSEPRASSQPGRRPTRSPA